MVKSANQSWRDNAGTLFKQQKQAGAGSRGVVSSNHPLASAAGVEMLALGGNAFDAAIAACFTLGVVEPMMVGIFGAGWMTLRQADGKLITIDNYSTAPAKAPADLYTPISDTWPDYMETVDQQNRVGYLACGVPGTLKAWAEVVASMGKLDLETVMQPAIRHAERGFPVSAYLHDCIVGTQEWLAKFAETTRLLLPQGTPLKAGEQLIQPDLAISLRAIAAEGPNLLYEGALGQTIVDDIAKNGGIMTMDDLRTYRTIRREPLRSKYREYELVAPPPPCSGGLHIHQILRLLAGYDVQAMGFGTTKSIHLLAECLKIAFADRHQYVGDPTAADVPVEWLISEGYAAERREDIDLNRAQRQIAGVMPSAESANTTHITAADADGNIACMTQTLNQLFGSKVIVPGTGILLNNTMSLFDPHPGQANSVGPSKRMVSSMSPTIVLKDGEPFMALGTPGGVRIFPSVMQAIVNVLDHGMSLQEAVEAPRIWTQGQELELEKTIPEHIEAQLQAFGHQTLRVPVIAGGMNGVMFKDGMIHGAACWRADGSPAALSGGNARPGVRFFA